MAAGLLLFCAAGFCTPAALTLLGYGVAGDRQKENAADVLAIRASDVQQQKQQQQQPPPPKAA